ncbi:hypothetical protein F4678DRAFT_463384 [Xylaria arbuscula]|nr:hypothetical protein F4678DRAFT_463384 [Xylaria arbuscula]
MGKLNYNHDSVYISRPYHALYISDEEEDDDEICVWKHPPSLSELSDCDSVEEPLAAHFQRLRVEAKGNQGPRKEYFEKAKNEGQSGSGKEPQRPQTTPVPKLVREAKEAKPQIKTSDIPLSSIDLETGKLTKEAFRQREVQYALSTARRSLTHMSQFLLKLEARAGKTTKEGIRQTLDATVQDTNYDFSVYDDIGHKSEIEEIKHLSNDLYHRLYLIDRHWRRIGREARKAGEKDPDIKLLGEQDVREWVKVELKTNHLSVEETCFYTVHDLASNRSFVDWISYLRKLCGFGDHPTEEAKLVELAWRFLDRNLRGPRPVNPTSVEQFIGGLYRKWEDGAFAERLKNPKKQELDDEAAWRLMRKYWSSRTAPS